MMELYFIRHGKTYGNTLGRYIGTTDEELCTEGREALARLKNSAAYRSLEPDLVFVSPLRRCLQTAEIFFPGVPTKICRDFRECDFGEFENKNYRELSGNPAYQAWIDSGGTLPFPGGECREEFEERCHREFWRALLYLSKLGAELQDGGRAASCAEDRTVARAEDKAAHAEDKTAEEQRFRAAFVIHGGTIMSILSAFAEPDETSLAGADQSDAFYRWQVKNGEGFLALWDETDKGGIRLYDISHIGPASGHSA